MIVPILFLRIEAKDFHSFYIFLCITADTSCTLNEVENTLVVQATYGST
jgi:hypothetical protein